VISRRTEGFRKLLAALPAQLQKQARSVYLLWRDNPGHPGLRFKRIHAKQDIWSVRMTNDYRALGIKEGDRMLWFWVGSHADYEKLLRKRIRTR
jgi:hypothetical protein